MSLKLQMVGTGSAFGKKYFNNNALVSTDGFNLLIDCGFTAPASLYQMGMKMSDIDAVLITHQHADHVGGLEEFAFMMKYAFRKKPTLYIPATLVQPLWEHSLKGGLEDKESNTTLESYFKVIPLEEKTIYTINEQLKVEIIRTPHIPYKPSYSLFFNEKIFYSADVTFSKKLLDEVHFDRKCTRILHDCQLFTPGIVHTSLTQLMTLPKVIQEKILLMHYGDDMEKFIGKTGFMSFIMQHEIYEM